MPVFRRSSGRSHLKRLEEFASTHEGVEGFLEPKTGVRAESLLLVDRGGEWLREEIADRNQAATLCRKRGVPMYDASVVGYPERMKGRRKKKEDIPSAAEIESWFSAGSSEEDGEKG